MRPLHATVMTLDELRRALQRRRATRVRLHAATTRPAPYRLRVTGGDGESVTESSPLELPVMPARRR